MPTTTSPKASIETRVRELEAELQKATERSRLAKQAVKDAKELAKAAKKDKRAARRALIAVQEEQEEALAAAEKKLKTQARVSKRARTGTAGSSLTVSVADSPEINPAPRTSRKRAKTAKPASEAAPVVEPVMENVEPETPAGPTDT